MRLLRLLWFAPRIGKNRRSAAQSQQLRHLLFAAHVTFPPPVKLAPTRMLFLCRIAPDDTQNQLRRIVLVPFDGRGPPIA